MMDWLLFGLFLTLMLAGVPIAVAMGLAGVAVVAVADFGMLSLPTNVYTGVAKYPLMAIPVFVIAGLIFERAGVAAGIVRFVSAIVGQRRGSLAIVAVLVAMIMGGISGSGPADSAAVGAVMLPSMLKAGYPRAFTASVIASAGSTGILIPPSIALIIYSLLVPAASVPALFAAGIIPGILVGVALILMAWWLSVRNGFEADVSAARPPFWQSLREAAWGLAAPVIILGGMRSGLFTPTEAAVVAVFYGIFVGTVINRQLGWNDIWKVFVEAAEISSVIMIIIALASVFAWASSTLSTFDRLAQTVLGTGLSETGMLLMIQGLLLVAGMFLDAISIYFIFLPLLVPIAMHFQWDLVWFGVIITMNLALGQFTPPMGVNLMVTCRMAGIGMDSTLRWVLWMVLAMGSTVLLVTFVPELALWLPRHLGYL
ncbi:tripartite ATP-independent transporter DctM subunit [Azonexus fungiphilus]|uniref:TRAP transporter large permease protein n=1 Tax=Azonexus fungiphilus TaxID=146940 RepID=A0A495VPG6_9RHOO|nr:TRAP transporter large permease [Azonexus fungiphilus]RKT50323.1 tripartite ATP-independent transporter DctM subunit [Azonexus fungiphilus]